MCTLTAYIQFNKPCAKLIYFVIKSKVYGGQFFGFYIKFKAFYKSLFYRILR